MQKEHGRGETRGPLGARPNPPRNGGRRKPEGRLAALAEQDAGENLLRFLSRLARFGLAAGEEPLLKPLKRSA